MHKLTVKKNSYKITFIIVIPKDKKGFCMGEKVSVIIPTIQKNRAVLDKVVARLNEDDSVSEILIINNAQAPMSVSNDAAKFKIFNMSQNIFVNPAWNLGIQNIQNDIFLIINDDILPVKDFVTKVIESGILDKKTTGLVGINPDFINQNDRTTTVNIDYPEENGCTLSFVTMNNYRNTGDWGSAFFGRKKNYYMIPNELRIIFGDNYLLYKNLSNAKLNYQMCGLPFNHIHSLSSASPEFSAVISSDIQLQAQFIP